MAESHFATLVFLGKQEFIIFAIPRKADPLQWLTDAYLIALVQDPNASSRPSLNGSQVQFRSSELYYSSGGGLCESQGQAPKDTTKHEDHYTGIGVLECLESLFASFLITPYNRLERLVPPSHP